MEFKTAEEKLLHDYAILEEENYQLKDQLMYLQNQLEDAMKDPTYEPKEESRDAWRINRPIEYVSARVNASEWKFKSERNPLGMTASEIRNAVSTDEGLESVCKKVVGYGDRIVEIRTVCAPFQIKSLGRTWAISLYDFGGGDVTFSDQLIDFENGPINLSHTYPIDRYDDVKAAALCRAKEELLKFADKIESDEQ